MLTTTEYIVQEAMEQVLGILTPSNRLVMRVILHTGLRVSDVLSLQTMQVKRQFYVTESKTGKRRRVNLPDALVRDLLEQAGSRYVFEHRTDPARHRTRQAVWADVKRAARAYRLPANVGTHTARKVYAVELMRRYGDLDKVRRALNHDNGMVTLLYAMADTLVKQRRGKRRKRGLSSKRNNK
jgi:integrase